MKFKFPSRTVRFKISENPFFNRNPLSTTTISGSYRYTMDRKEEFLSYLPEEIREQAIPSYHSKFYDDITEKIDNFNTTTTSYTEMLKKEKEFSTLWTQTLQLFSKIELETNKDQRNFFDGIRAIIQLKLDNKNELIQQKKKRFINKNIELEPERPQIVLNTQKNSHFEAKNKQILKQDNKFDQAIERTKKYLLDIKQLQNQISSNLISQTESIDQIYQKSKQTHGNVKGTNKLLKKNKEKKRLMRRILVVWLLSLAFMMLYLHISK